MANDINLIPPPDLEKKKQNNRKAIWGGLLAAVLILVGYFGVYSLLERNAGLTRELKSVAVNEAEYQDAVKTHQDLIDQINAAKDRLNDLEGNLPKAFGWSAFLRDIEGGTPEDIVFTSIEFSERALYIQGNYMREADLSRLLVKLRGLDDVESARILSTSLNEDKTLHDFELQCDLISSVYPEESTPSPEAPGDAGTDEGAGSQEGGADHE